MTGMKHERIEKNPQIMVGKPVIKGTRITVELIAEETAAGLSVEEIIDCHPHLTREDIDAARAYAAAGNYLGPAPQFIDFLRRTRAETERLDIE